MSGGNSHRMRNRQLAPWLGSTPQWRSVCCSSWGRLSLGATLSAEGLFLASSPSSSFFYVLTAMHGLHLLGGVMGLAYVLYRLTQSTGPHETRVLGVASVYWHFMDGLVGLSAGGSCSPNMSDQREET